MLFNNLRRLNLYIHYFYDILNLNKNSTEIIPGIKNGYVFINLKSKMHPF
jgi:hypothetical protein